MVEAVNTSPTQAAAHTGLGTSDLVVELTGLVNLSATGFNPATHTLA